MRGDRLAATTVTAVLLLVGCTGTPADQPSAPSPTASSATSTTSSPAAPSTPPVPSATPTPTATRSTALSPPVTSPTPREPDAATLRKALVTATDLGKPWVQVDSPTDTDEACPGQRSAVGRLALRAAARRDLTRGSGELVNGATFQLADLAGVEAAEVRAAWGADTRSCRRYTDGEGFYVEYSAADPTTVGGVDEVLLARVERVYFDRGDDEPAYARHTLVARTGQVVATVTHTFLPAGSDPEADDLGAATKLLQTQLDKVDRALE